MAAGLTAVAVAAGSMITANDAVAAAPAAISPAAAKINSSLDAMARLLARAVTQPSLRQQIHTAVGRKFDGDFDVLYKNFASTSGVRSALASADAAQSPAAVDRLAAAIPRFQIAVPANFGAWNAASYTPLVASMPTGVQDTTLKTITAYDAAGRAHQLDAQHAPARPVIVLGLNERTDAAGRLLPQHQGSGAQAAAAATYQVRMTKVHLIDDNEPWPKGDAEIAVRVQGCGTDYTDFNWSSLQDSGDYWVGPRYLGNTTCNVYFYWWEDDGSSFDFTLSYKGVSLNVKMDDDDLIGGALVAHSKFEGDSDDKMVWSDLEQWTD